MSPAAQLLTFLECSTTRYLCVSLSKRSATGLDGDKNYTSLDDKMRVRGGGANDSQWDSGVLGVRGKC